MDAKEVRQALEENEIQIKLKHLNGIVTELGNLSYLRVIASELGNITDALEALLSYLERQDLAEVEEEPEEDTVVEEEEEEESDK